MDLREWERKHHQPEVSIIRWLEYHPQIYIPSIDVQYKNNTGDVSYPNVIRSSGKNLFLI